MISDEELCSCMAGKQVNQVSFINYSTIDTVWNYFNIASVLLKTEGEVSLTLHQKDNASVLVLDREVYFAASYQTISEMFFDLDVEDVKFQLNEPIPEDYTSFEFLLPVSWVGHQWNSASLVYKQFPPGSEKNEQVNYDLIKNFVDPKFIAEVLFHPGSCKPIYLTDLHGNQTTANISSGNPSLFEILTRFSQTSRYKLLPRISL